MIDLTRHRLPKPSDTPPDRVARKYFLSQEAVDMLEELSGYLNRNLSDTLEVLIRDAAQALPQPDDALDVPGFNEGFYDDE